VYLQDGSIAWETETEAFLHTPPAIADDVAYATGEASEDRVTAIDVTDGTVLESSPVDRTMSYASPVVHDDAVYVAAQRGVLRIDGDGGGGAGSVDLLLDLDGDTAAPGREATVTFRLSNRGDAEATGLQGFVTPPSDDWELVQAGEFTTLGPGTTETATVTFGVPDDASGEYTFSGVVEDDAGNSAEDRATVTVGPNLRLAVQPTRRTAVPGEYVAFELAVENPGSEAISDPRVGVNTHFLVDCEPLEGLVAEELAAAEATWSGGGRRAVLEWDSLPAGRTFTPTLTFGVDGDVETGEYGIQFDSYYRAGAFVDGPNAAATVAVEVFDRFRAEKLDLAATVDELTVRGVDDERRAQELLSEIESAMDDGDVSRERAEAAAERMVLLDEVDEFWLRGVSRADYRRDIDSRLAEETAVGVLKAATSVLVTKWIAKKVALRLELSEIAEYLLEVALKLVEKALEILVDHLLGVVPAMAAKAKASANARELADDVLDGAFDGAGELADAVGETVDAGAAVVGDAFRSFFEPGVLADLQSMDAFGADELADGLEGTQTGAKDGHGEYVDRMHETFETAHEVLEAFEEEYETFATRSTPSP
jgi:hypothetical protein